MEEQISALENQFDSMEIDAQDQDNLQVRESNNKKQNMFDLIF